MGKQLALNPNARLEKTEPYVRPRVKQDVPAYGDRKSVV